ncbi:MAG: tyrosine-type recombinase/integrase [Diaphorobacter nitroreducens]|uniref:tyrosine-type recombinase/integrase n=1 Tax=Diaphorobacter nitroreducens TaxID=164759 RepID=UPI003C77C8DC
MAKPRLKPSGKWEIGLRHPSLPNGRKYFTFDTEGEAIAYGQQWKLMKHADIPPPAELTTPTSPGEGVRLSRILGEWSDSGFAAPTQILTLKTLTREVGAVRFSEASYKWLTGYLRTLKVEKNLSPTSIKHRIQALSRAIDEYLRHNLDVKISNPVKLLPKGYSTYSDVDAQMVKAKGGKVKVSEVRDRRLLPGEHEKILTVLSGYERPDRARGLELKGGDALLTLYLLILNTGLRLREAYTLTRVQIDMENKVIRVKETKQWRGKISFRDVPMRPEVHQALSSYFASRPPFERGALVFPFLEEEGVEKGKKGLTRASSRLSFRFRIAFEYMDIVGLHEHDLRHEATCRWLELKDADGRDMFRLEELNKIMGWKPGSVMAQRYASFRGVDLAQRLWPAPEAAGASAAAA